jgi:3-phenylpropionate/trans-cinnamate dioxygenase ferredoxin reductase subunit
VQIVIVGASLAGANAAAQLRKDGFDGRIVLVGEESERPYERPTLSKESLRGEPPHRLFIHGPTFYEDNAIDLRLGTRVASLDLGARRVVTENGTAIPYDRLLLTTGCSARELRVPGRELDGVITLRTLADTTAIRDRALTAERIVVVGGGWIGAEVAASLRQMGRNVVMVMPSDVPLERPLGPEVGELYRAVHAEEGVELRPREHVVAYRGSGGRFEAAETAKGTLIEGDLAVVGVGADPRTELAAAAGIEIVDDGIAVDEFQRTSAPDVYAAGDVASSWHPLFKARVRLEHWDNARRQARAAAGSMLGRRVPYERVPYFYSDQFDVSMEYAGRALSWDDVAIRPMPGRRAFLAFWLRGGALVAALNANVDGINPTLSRLVGRQQAFDPAVLADPSVDIASLLPEGTP